MKNLVLKIIVPTVLLLSSLISIAQPSTPKNPNPTDERFNPFNNPEAPIDDAILLLLIAAVGLGLYMLARRYKKRTARS